MSKIEFHDMGGYQDSYNHGLEYLKSNIKTNELDAIASKNGYLRLSALEGFPYAKDNLTKAKANLDYIIAKVSMQYREDHNNAKQKVTEKYLDNQIVLNDEVLAAKELLRNVELLHNQYVLLNRNFETRDNDLLALVNLFRADYFSLGNELSGTEDATGGFSEPIKEECVREIDFQQFTQNENKNKTSAFVDDTKKDVSTPKGKDKLSSASTNIGKSSRNSQDVFNPGSAPF